MIILHQEMRAKPEKCDTEHDLVGLAGLEPAGLILIRDHRVRAAESGHAGGLNHRAERC